MGQTAEGDEQIGLGEIQGAGKAPGEEVGQKAAGMWQIPKLRPETQRWRELGFRETEPSEQSAFNMLELETKDGFLSAGSQSPPECVSGTRKALYLDTRSDTLKEILLQG